MAAVATTYNLEVVLFSKFPPEYCKKQVRQLSECGVRVLNLYNSEHLAKSKAKLPKCDAVLFMHQLASPSDCDGVEKIAKKHGVPFIRLPRQFSTWPDLFAPLLKKKGIAPPRPGLSAPEVTFIRRKKTEPVLQKGIPSPEQLPLPESEIRLKAAPIVEPEPPLDPAIEIVAPEDFLKPPSESFLPPAPAPRDIIQPVRPRPPMPPLPSNSPIQKFKKLAETPPAPPSAPAIEKEPEKAPESRIEPEVSDENELAKMALEENAKLVEENTKLRSQIQVLEHELAFYRRVSPVLQAISTIQDYLRESEPKKYAQAAE